MKTFTPPGATLGVMGGGQLARMFLHAAQRLGYRTVVLDPDEASPAGLIAHRHIRADYADHRALEELARHCAAVTTEFENVPADSLRMLAQHSRVAPGAAAVAVCQDRLAEKALFMRCAVACAPHARIASEDDLAAAPDSLLPGILKTARLGYDGKGQRRVADRAAVRRAFAELGGVACVLEKLMPLRDEISVLVARGADGALVHLPLQHNLHRDGILAVTTVPAPGIAASIGQRAAEAAAQIAAALDYVGVLCVEFFVLQDGSLLANEMAPRPHNSGHYGIDACDLSQFELQVRTLVGAPLAVPRLHSPCVMLNLLGDLWFAPDASVREPDWPSVLALPGAHLHLYGKAAARPGRKMGHLTLTAPTAEAAHAVALRAAACLGIAPF